MKLGEVVKTFRQKNKISMETFANKAEISKGYVSMLEHGINPQTKKRIAPTLDVMNKLASAMGITLDSLVSQLDPDERITTSPTITSPILSVYNRLNDARKQRVFTFAKNELAEQQTEITNDEPELLAAHLDDENMTDDERQQVNDFLRKIRNDKTE